MALQLLQTPIIFKRLVVLEDILQTFADLLEANTKQNPFNDPIYDYEYLCTPSICVICCLDCFVFECIKTKNKPLCVGCVDRKIFTTVDHNRIQVCMYKWENQDPNEILQLIQKLVQQSN